MVGVGAANKVIGVAARAKTGEGGKAVTLTGYAASVAAFGEDEAGKPGMSTLLRLLFAGGAATVVAVAVGGEATTADYAAAFGALGAVETIQIVVCDSGELEVQQKLRDCILEASENRRERIAVVGSGGESVEQLVTRAAALNCERVLLVGPDVLDGAGKPLPGVFGAAAVAAAIAVNRDPAAPLNGVKLYGLGGLAQSYDDNDVDRLVRGGVTPLEEVAGVISPVRGITTRTTTGGAADATWREAATILIVDNVIPAIRASLRSKFTRSKNTAQTRSAVRSQVIVELENKLKAEIIDDYGDVVVTALEEDPTVCVVEFAFTVAHGLNQIWLTAHITV